MLQWNAHSHHPPCSEHTCSSSLPLSEAALEVIFSRVFRFNCAVASISWISSKCLTFVVLLILGKIQMSHGMRLDEWRWLRTQHDGSQACLLSDGTYKHLSLVSACSLFCFCGTRDWTPCPTPREECDHYESRRCTTLYQWVLCLWFTYKNVLLDHFLLFLFSPFLISNFTGPMHVYFS